LEEYGGNEKKNLLWVNLTDQSSGRLEDSEGRLGGRGSGRIVPKNNLTSEGSLQKKREPQGLKIYRTEEKKRKRK